MKHRVLLLISLLCNIPVLFAMTAPVYKDSKAESSDDAGILAVGQRDIEAKSATIIDLVHSGIAYFKKNSVENSCKTFTHDPSWRRGEIFVYVLDANGRILCYGDDSAVLWKHVNSFDRTKRNIFDQFTKVSDQGSWISYMWNNGFQSAYVKKVIKNGETFYLAAGFYPESQEYITKELVELAAQYALANGIKNAAIEINNMFGQFVKGEVSLALYDFNGNLLANPEAVGLVGQNASKIFDERGVGLIQGDLAIANNRRGSGWRNSQWKNTTFRRYIQRVIDPSTKKKYYIVGGYYPDISRQDMIGFVRRGISHLKGAGPQEAFADFNNTAGDYVKGPLSIFVYDFNGRNLADGEHPNFVGKDLLDRKDAEGTYITKKIIDQAKAYGQGSFTYIDRNAYKTIYFEVVKIKNEKYIIGSGYYPSSKSQAVQAMVYKAESHVLNNPVHKAFEDFANVNSEFFRGDLYIFAYTPSGIELVNGLNTNFIWKDFSDSTDDRGKKIISEAVSLAQAGGGWTTYKMFGAERRVYLRLIEKYDPISKTTEKIIIGSQYYL